MNESKPTHLDLFSGIGGFSLAFEAEGFETIGFAEIDPYASAVLKKHWPNVPNYGDVRNVPNIFCDVITGGFPCQPFSLAGKRKGARDDRNLWPSMRDVIQKVRPHWVVCENVPGAVAMVLDSVIVDLENIGYAVQPFIVPAHAVGLPQIEGARLFIVAASDGERCNPRDKISEVFGVACCQAACNESGRGLRDFRGDSGRVWQAPVSAFDGVDYGLPGELDRIKCLGNAVPPALARPFAKAIRQLI